MKKVVKPIKLVGQTGSFVVAKPFDSSRSKDNGGERKHIIYKNSFTSKNGGAK